MYICATPAKIIVKIILKRKEHFRGFIDKANFRPVSSSTDQWDILHIPEKLIAISKADVTCWIAV